MLADVKAQIIEKSMAYCEVLTNQNKNAKEEWFKLVGEDIDVFINKVMGKERAGDRSRWGGHVEAMIFNWRADSRLTLILADEIRGGMSADDARKQVIDMPWPEDDDSSKTLLEPWDTLPEAVVILLSCLENHVSWLLFCREDEFCDAGAFFCDLLTKLLVGPLCIDNHRVHDAC